MTTQPVSIKIVASGSFPTAWYQTQPPNGCLPCHTERTVLHVEVYEADYYGIPKLYARGYATLERPHYPCSHQRFGHWDDGHPTRVNEWLEKIRAASPNESISDNASNSQWVSTQTRSTFISFAGRPQGILQGHFATRILKFSLAQVTTSRQHTPHPTLPRHGPEPEAAGSQYPS